MEKYYGPLNTRAKLISAARKLALKYGEYNKAAAADIMRRWEYYAARPAEQARIVTMLNTECLDMQRPGSIMHKLLGVTTVAGAGALDFDGLVQELTR